MVNQPRFMIAAPASGHGKTMLTIALMIALRKRGARVAPFKVGPDYIDPGYHTLATGRVSRNLDAVMCPPEMITPLVLHGCRTPEPADIAIIEGVMGLFDGRLGQRGAGSAAHIAALTATPVILCADASHTSRTIAATVAGIASWDRRVRIAGVIFNKVSSPRQQTEIADAMSRVPVPVLGFIPKDPNAQTPSRHLGLVPIKERMEAAESLACFADLVVNRVDLDALQAIAATAPELVAEAWEPTAQVHPASDLEPVVALAGGKAFTFRYAETEELLRAGGCRVVEFDPTRDTALPEGTCGLYLGGGFPEVHAEQIGGNHQLLAAVREAVHRGVPTVAECAGLLYLAQTLDGRAMTSALPIQAAMSPRLTMGYRWATAPGDTLLAAAGTSVVGHEFHRTTVSGPSELDPAWEFGGLTSDGVSADPAGRGRPSVHASYLHTHWAGYPTLAQHFIDAVHTYAGENNEC